MDGLAVGVTGAEMKSAAARAIDLLIAEFEQKEAEEQLEACRRLVEALFR